MPRLRLAFSGIVNRGFQNVYELRLEIGPNRLYPEVPGITHLSRNEANLTAVLPQTSTILACLGQAAFVWDLATDTIAWSDHAGAVFADIAPEALSSGAEFSRLIEPKRSVRSEALTLSPPVHGEEGVPYRIEYGVRAATSAPLLWI